jgi:hypothetical protein
MKRDTKKAFEWIVNILRKTNSKFQISGGLAARIYGSTRELADIDIDVLENKLPEIQKKTKEYITYGPKIYKDDEFNLVLMSLNYKGQEQAFLHQLHTPSKQKSTKILLRFLMNDLQAKNRP